LEKGYFEIGVNSHNFGPVATNGLRNCHNFFKSLVLDIGVTLQARIFFVSFLSFSFSDRVTE
jgi:hypothetical protein